MEVQESLCGSGSTHSGTEEDNHDVVQLVLGSLAQTLYNTALLHQVTQHETADKSCSTRQDEADDDSHDDGEENLLTLADLAELLHLNLTFFFGGQSAHNGRLDDGHKCHVAVGSHGDRTEEMGSQLGGEEDGSRTISATDDTDAGSLGASEAHQVSTDKGYKDSELGSST